MTGNREINGKGCLAFHRVETRDMKMTMKATKAVRPRDPYFET
jgi:hypothetical protein